MLDICSWSSKNINENYANTTDISIIVMFDISSWSSKNINEYLSCLIFLLDQAIILISYANQEFIQQIQDWRHLTCTNFQATNVPANVSQQNYPFTHKEKAHSHRWDSTGLPVCFWTWFWTYVIDFINKF